MADIIQQRRDTAARWAQYNPILLEGEVGYVTDNPNQYKIGNGRDKWNDLPLRGYTGTITQDTGDDENAVMSQKAVSAKLSELGSEVGEIKKGAGKIVDEKVVSSNYYIYSSKFEVKEGGKYIVRIRIPNYTSNNKTNIKLRTSSGDITPESKYGVKSFDDYVDIDLIPTASSNEAYVAMYGEAITPNGYEAEIIVFDNSIGVDWYGDNIRMNTKDISENKKRLDDAESLNPKRKINISGSGEWLPKKDKSGGIQVQGYTNHVFNVEGLEWISVDAVIGGILELATIATASSKEMASVIRVIESGKGNNETVSKKVKLEDGESYLFVVCPNGYTPTINEIYSQKEINQFVVDLQGNIYTEYQVMGNQTDSLYIKNIPVQKNATYIISIKSNVDFKFDKYGNCKFVYSNKENGVEQSLANISIAEWVTIKLKSDYDDIATLKIYNYSKFNNDVQIDVKVADENTSQYIVSLLSKVSKQGLELDVIKEYSVEGVGYYDGDNSFRLPNEYSYKKILEYKDSTVLSNNSWAGGVALFDKYAVVLYNGGYMAVFDIYSKALLAHGATATNGVDNHYNCGIFTNQIIEGDLFPVIYTSKCAAGSSDCYVERIKIDGKSLTTQLLQTITCSSDILPSDKNCDWLIDKKTNSLVMLYSLSSDTIKVVYFNMPNLNNSNIVLTSSDVVDEIEVSDSYLTARQGSFVYDKMLYYAQGTDRQQIAVIDLKTQSVVTKIDLSPLTVGEIEAVYVYGGKIYVNAHTDNGLEIKLYELIF